MVPTAYCVSTPASLMIGGATEESHAYLYILRCCDGSYYVGHRDDLGKRISDHLSGGISVYTRKRRPLHLVFSESFSRREEALARASEGVVTREKGGADQRQWERLGRLARNLY